MISVKSGKNADVNDVRDLAGVRSREDAEIGVFVTLKQPTPDMEKEAASHGFYSSKFTGENHPRIQILTMEDPLDGEEIDMPPVGQVNETFQEGPTVRHDQHEQMTMQLEKGAP